MSAKSIDTDLLQRLVDKPIQTDGPDKPKSLPDLLNHKKVARKVVETIADASKIEESPCIAIFGPWGTGKTGILNLVRKELGDEKYVWNCTDAWHNQRADLVILEILRELCEEAGPDFKTAFLRLLFGISGHAADAMIGMYLPGAPKAADVAKAIKEAFPEGLPSSREQLIKSEFEKVVEKLSGNGKKRLVIAIDNLDRCRPEAALEVLETLFLITHVPNCAFIVAADQQVLVSFLNREYKDTDFSGTKYLEKIFPYYFRVPDPWVAWAYKETKDNEDEVMVLLEFLIPKENPWRRDPKTFKMLWHYFSQPRALRNPRRIKRILRRVLDYKFEKDDLEEYGQVQLSQNLLFLVVLSDLWPQVYDFFMTSGPKSWRSWLDFMASRKGSPPSNGVLLNDYELQDFLFLVRKFNDGTFDDTIIGDQERLWNYWEDVAELGL
jgi:hypothetical protein